MYLFTVHGSARGSGLPITVIRAVTPSTQVKTSIMQPSVRDAGIRMAGAAYTCRRPDDASNCYYSLIVPNIQPTYSYLHSIIFSLLLCLFSSPCRRHLGNGEHGPDPTHKQIIQSLSILQSLPLEYDVFFDNRVWTFPVSLPSPNWIKI